MSDIIDISKKLLRSVKDTDAQVGLIKHLAETNPTDLVRTLNSDAHKKAFWINIYNAFTYILLQKQKEKIDLNKPWQRIAFFSRSQINLAGKVLSLNDIEHGFLRHSKIWWSKGYLEKMSFMISSFEKSMRVNKLDERIHFALNCGATSCPPVSYYIPEKIDRQLNLATRSFLRSEITYDLTQNCLYLPAVFSKYENDFDGKKGIIRFLKDYRILAENQFPKIIYLPYNWTPKYREVLF